MYSTSVLQYQNQTEAEKVARTLTSLRVVSKQSRVVREEAPPPYTTLTMLEDTASKLGWDGRRTMAVAQSLFEQGLITYPRTDSTHVTSEAKAQAAKIIRTRYGANSLRRRNVMASTDSSGAHEAIRPADPQQFPEHQAGLLPDAAALYQLVWDRFLASEMKAARYQIIDVELENV
jgi:DNA topoisomerase-1